MSNLQAFMAQNVVESKTIKKVISDRFVDSEGNAIPFEFRAITQEVDKELKKKCTKKEKVKKRYVDKFDSSEYEDCFIAACMVYPNLKDADLQKSYGALGEVELLRSMLIPGERAEALLIATEVNGYDKDMDELVEEVKN